jgi:hypothetical protein
MKMLASPQYTFAPWAIKGAPDDPGLFALYCREELICIGIARGSSAQDTIRARLLALYEDAANAGTITHYQWEITSKPDVKRSLYLKQLRHVPADCDQLPSRGGQGPAPGSS